MSINKKKSNNIIYRSEKYHCYLHKVLSWPMRVCTVGAQHFAQQNFLVYQQRLQPINKNCFFMCHFLLLLFSARVCVYRLSWFSFLFLTIWLYSTSDFRSPYLDITNYDNALSFSELSSLEHRTRVCADTQTHTHRARVSETKCTQKQNPANHIGK